MYNIYGILRINTLFDLTITATTINTDAAIKINSNISGSFIVFSHVIVKLSTPYNSPLNKIT